MLTCAALAAATIYFACKPGGVAHLPSSASASIALLPDDSQESKCDIATPVSADSSQPWHRYQSVQNELLHAAVHVPQIVNIMLMTVPYYFFPHQMTKVDRNSSLQKANHHKATARACGPVQGAASGTLGSSNLTCMYYVNANERSLSDIDAFW